MGTILTNKDDIVVFSQQIWENQSSRIYQLMTRLGKGRKVLFVELSMPTNVSKNTIKLAKITRNIRVLKIKSGIANLQSSLAKIVTYYSAKWKMNPRPILWFYTPVFNFLLDDMSHSLVVFDYLGSDSVEVANNPKLSLDLIIKSDLVLSCEKEINHLDLAGHKLVYMPNAVDKFHFEKAFEKNLVLPQDVVNFKNIVVGFYGDLDNTVDFKLFSDICRLAPKIDFVAIGKLKIDLKQLPKQKNFHYLGQKEYQELPGYLKMFDIAILPYNVAGKHKHEGVGSLLEYLTTRKKVISKNFDVISAEYVDLVALADSAEEFLDKINYYINEPFAKKVHREFLQDRFIRSISWEKTVSNIELLLKDSMYTTQKMSQVTESTFLSTKNTLENQLR